MDKDTIITTYKAIGSSLFNYDVLLWTSFPSDNQWRALETTDNTALCIARDARRWHITEAFLGNLNDMVLSLEDGPAPLRHPFKMARFNAVKLWPNLDYGHAAIMESHRHSRVDYMIHTIELR